MNESQPTVDKGAIAGIEDLQLAQLQFELSRGARFVIYTYCISVIFMSFQRTSKIHFLNADQSAIPKGLSYSLISFLFGWWGIPWGPIYTVGTIFNNFRGGIDVTQDVMHALTSSSATTETV
jgi:hypothetical protein